MAEYYDYENYEENYVSYGYDSYYDETTTTTQAPTTTTIPFSYDFDSMEYFTYDADGKPEVNYPSKPNKRPQKDGEKGTAYKVYVSDVYKPLVEQWKELNDHLKEKYETLVTQYEASKTTTTSTTTST